MELFEQFVKERRYLKNVSPSTEQWYKYSWKALGPFLEPCFSAKANGSTGGAIRDALLRGIEALHASNSPIYINTYLRCIQAFLNWCHEGGHIRERIKVGRLKEQLKILNTFTSEHLRRLVACRPRSWGDHRILTIALLLLDAGLRIEEALSLRREDVDLDNLLIRVLGKGGKYRQVPMSLELRRILFRWLSKTEQTLCLAPVRAQNKGNATLCGISRHLGIALASPEFG